jgi:hypothetical protein
MREQHGLLPGGSFQLRVARRHVDLLRVSSALCRGASPAGR